MSSADRPVISRRLTLVGGKIIRKTNTTPELLSFRLEGVNRPLQIQSDQKMRFGDEVITARTYFKRVIEPGDLIDVITNPMRTPAPAPLPLSIFWIHIHYAEDSSLATPSFRRKDDGHFALRAKAGEKAERAVAGKLWTDLGHPLSSKFLDPPGYFSIWYTDKRRRKLDVICPRCSFKLEIKRRNKDWLYRVSHSDRRPFWSENSEDGWHAFVFPDLSSRFIRNTWITAAIRAGKFKPGRDRHDAWADISPDALRTEVPPGCTYLT